MQDNDEVVSYFCLKLAKTSNIEEIYPVLSNKLLTCEHANSRGKVWRHDGFQMDFCCSI